MSLLYKEHRDAFSFGIWHITETEDELESLSGCSAPARLSNLSRRREYLAIRALFVSVGLDPGKVDYLPSGKPFLRDDPRDISLSHTKDYSAIVVSSHSSVGIDIEQRTERVVRVRHKFMHPLEEAALMEATLKETHLDTNTGLLVHWCAKEAVFKAVPEEAIDFAHEIRVTRLPLLQPLFDVDEMDSPIPDSPHQDAEESNLSKKGALTQDRTGEVDFLRTNTHFRLEGWSTRKFIMVICHSPLTDHLVSK